MTTFTTIALTVTMAISMNAPKVETMTVSNVVNDKVFCVDTLGEEWSFYGDDFSVNENIEVIMIGENIVEAN